MGRKNEVVFDEQPPDFDPANPYKDPVAMLEMRDHIVREKWIDIETFKIIRNKLRWCYRIEGVNHLQKCRHLVQQYMDSTHGIGWGKNGRHLDQHGPSLHSITVHFCFIIFFLFYSNSLFLFQVQKFRAWTDINGERER
ncbi:putative NADH dehydrogenase [ubiquinone] 1 beta subcomplex subunit 10 [Helianthus debilis subsp. tardiflorus]